jgi:hypothetical protein
MSNSDANLSYYSVDQANIDKYEEMKTKIGDWCSKLYQDNKYSYKQYQSCLDKLDSGSISFNKNKDTEHILDSNKDLERIYGYYKKDKEKLNKDSSNPNMPVIEDDFQKMTLYHFNKNKFLIANKDGILSLEIDPDKEEEKEWQLVSLGIKNESNVFAIMSKYGKFIMGNEDGSVIANTSILSTWCQWKMIKYNNNFGFKSIVHNKYLAPVGDELLLMDGWTDNNLWVLKKKENPSGNNNIRYDNSKLMLKKEVLLNRYYDNYLKYLDYKYRSSYLSKNMDLITDLRRKQMNYLLDIADKNLNSNLSILNNLNLDSATKPGLFGIKNIDDQISSYYAQCKISNSCLQAALGFSTRSTDNTNLGEERINDINDSIIDCDWTSKQIQDMIDYNFIPETSDFCNKLKDNILKTIRSGINLDSNETELFKNDVILLFETLRNNDHKNVFESIEENNNKMNDSLEEYKKSEEALNVYIKNLTDEIANSEKQIYKLSDSLEIKLDLQNNIGLNILNNTPDKNYEDLTNIINTNYDIARANLKNQKHNAIYLSIELIIVIIIIGFLIFKSLKKYNIIAS